MLIPVWQSPGISQCGGNTLRNMPPTHPAHDSNTVRAHHWIHVHALQQRAGMNTARLCPKVELTRKLSHVMYPINDANPSKYRKDRKCPMTVETNPTAANTNDSQYTCIYGGERVIRISSNLSSSNKRVSASCQGKSSPRTNAHCETPVHLGGSTVNNPPK